jgi:molybdopterin molybdotransferase
LKTGTCMSVPTGGDVPDGADAVVMLEHTEDYGDGTVGVLKPAAPGDNMIFRGDDVKPGDRLLKSGCRLRAHNIGALAALGVAHVRVRTIPIVGILSTGDELVDFTKKPEKGRIREVNAPLLSALPAGSACQTVSYGIVRTILRFWMRP